MQELEDGKTILTYDEAIKFLPKGEKIHTFLDGGIALVGANSDRQYILDLLKEADSRQEIRYRIEVSGPSAQEMKHGLAVLRTPGDWDSVMFIETNKRTDK